MKKIVLLSFILLICGSAKAESYLQTKKQIRNILVSCLKDPENSKFSSAYNSCLLDASNNFIRKADIEFNRQYQKADAIQRSNLLTDKKIYRASINHCEIFQDLSYDGFTKEAMCKLQTAKDYLSLLTNGSSSLPNNWTIENRVDNLFIGF